MDMFYTPLVEQLERELHVCGCNTTFATRVINNLNTKIKFSIKELSLIANLPRHLQIIVLSVATNESLKEYKTYTSQSINLKDLERVATGRMIPSLGWPRTLPPKLLHVQAILAYDQPLVIPDCGASDWNARIFARVIGMIGLRVGTFPPVLPARVVFTPLNLTAICGSKTERIPEDQIPPQVLFAIGLDTAAMILFSGENREKVNWEWIAGLIQQQQQADEETEVLVNSRFSGFVFGACLAGCKLPLPFIYNLLLRSGSAHVKSSILAALAFGEASDEIVNLLRLNSPFHEDDYKGECTMAEQTASLFALSILKRGSGDRQLLKELISLIDGPLCLSAAMALGLVANDINQLCDSQIEKILRGANGSGVNHLYSQIACILVILLLGNEETVDVILQDDRDVGYVRFLKHFTIFWLSRPYKPIVSRVQDPWILSAYIFHLAFNKNNEEAVKFLIELRVSSGIDSKTYDGRVEMQGWEFMAEVRAITLSVLQAGTGDLDALRIIRSQLQSPLGGDYGRNCTMTLALSLLCLGTLRRRLKVEPKLLLLAILPWWQKEAELKDGFTVAYPHFYRFLWLKMLELNMESEINAEMEVDGLGVKELGLLNQFCEWNGLNKREETMCDPLEVAIRLAQCKKPSLHIL